MQLSLTTRAALETAIDALRAERTRLDVAMCELQLLLGTETLAAAPSLVMKPDENEALRPDIAVALRGPKPKQQPRRITNPTSDKHTPITRKPNIELTPEQIAAMKRAYREHGTFAAAAEAADVSFYVAKKRIVTWQIEGIL
jgi:hypothetical protein